jgi:transposase
MATLFWDRKGVLMVEFIQQSTTITSQVYCETLKTLRRAIQNKRRGMMTPGVVLLHDNERPHTAARTRALLEHFNWEFFDQPSYSPDLAPSYYHLFIYLRKWVGSQLFNNNVQLMEGVKTCLSSQAADFFDTGVQKLVPQYDKWLNFGDDYFEKYLCI